jgi:hypothetical protein
MSTNAIVQSRPTPQIKKNAPIAARPELRCEQVFFMADFRSTFHSVVNR